MSETLLANLFFIITGSAILLVVAFLCLVLYHAWKAVRVAREILERVQKSTELLVKDVETFRTQVLHGGLAKQLVSMVLGAISKGTSRRRSRKKNVTKDDEE